MILSSVLAFCTLSVIRLYVHFTRGQSCKKIIKQCSRIVHSLLRNLYGLWVINRRSILTFGMQRYSAASVTLLVRRSVTVGARQLYALTCKYTRALTYLYLRIYT